MITFQLEFEILEIQVNGVYCGNRGSAAVIRQFPHPSLKQWLS